MATADERCSRAVAASREVIREECEGVNGEMVEVAPDIFAFVPDDRAAEFDFDLNSPETENELAAAVESCMDSEWAEDWASSVLDEDAPAAAREAAKRRACEGLFD